MKYIYLDWNVIQHMKHKVVENSINGIETYEIIKKLSKKYRFPFSEGHLKDLSTSFKPKNYKYIDEDLNFLNTLSGGYILSIDSKDKIVPIQCFNIKELFNDLVNQVKKEPEIYILGDKYNIDLENVKNKNIFKSFLKLNKGELNANVFRQLLTNIWLKMDDPSFYKLFREQVSNLKSEIENQDTLLSDESQYYEGIIPFLDFMANRDISEIEEKFDLTLKSFLSIDNRNIDNLSIGRKIEIIYMLLDFHPLFRDKINKKNRPSNVYRDIKNLFFASQAKYYVTTDKSTIKKASFIIKFLSLDVKVLNMSDFNIKFC